MIRYDFFSLEALGVLITSFAAKKKKGPGLSSVENLRHYKEAMQRDVNEKVGENRPSSCREFFFFASFLGRFSWKHPKILPGFFFNGEESLIIKFWIWKNFIRWDLYDHRN